MQNISFRDLFDHIGTGRMTFSKRAEDLSGQEVELRGYLVAMHADPQQITLGGRGGHMSGLRRQAGGLCAPAGFQSRR